MENPPPPHLVVAIDGPAASGKSSVARALAHRLGFVYVNTGAMYRAVTWRIASKDISCADATAVLAEFDGVEIQCGVRDCESTITIDGVDPTPHLLTPLVNENVSHIAAIPEIRRRLVALQREYAQEHDVVMEGRDIGSAVFPDTLYKFYIDASPEVRAQRRQRQGLLDPVQARDRQDSSRRASPLVIAEDAHVIDSSKLTVDGVVGELIGRLKLHGLKIEDGRSVVTR
ncbi:MAG TPA: (d)CMP kinase [Chthoniobacteraceae bacterium]